jgi:hypothetical protein
MAAKTNVQEAAPAQRAQADQPVTAAAILVLVAGWLAPGVGHMIQKRWIRGILLLTCVFAMFFLGLAMQGKVYSPNTGDILDILGFIGDLGAGAIYMVSKSMGWGQGAIHRATAAFGTTYVIVAGLLNIISAIDAYHIALGKKK